MTNPSPNAVPAWLKQLIEKYDDWQECEEYHIHDGTDEHEGNTPTPHDFDSDKFATAILDKFAGMEKAYGGCHNCYGKGYATVNGRWSGFDTDQDIGGSGRAVSAGKFVEMEFCTCSRGEQLEQLMEEKE